MTAHFSQMINF